MAEAYPARRPPGTEPTGFEDELENRLHPVDPDPRFVERLHRRLITIPEIDYEPPVSNRERLLAVMLVVMVIALAIAIARAIKRYACCRGE